MKKIWPSLEFFLVLLSLKTMPNNRASPRNGPIKNLFYKILTNNEIVKNSKSELKKFILVHL
jgi:hypothetical protein